MHQEKITAIFDQQAATYDEKWGRLAPINSALHLLTGAVLSGLPSTAHVLCVGVGTGSEILQLAETFPEWRFTAVEPSSAMLAVCQRRAEERGISQRCIFHQGYLDSLPSGQPFDAATAFLVSQFLLERPARIRFFHDIADRLCPDGILISSDLAGDLAATECQAMLEVWFRLMKGGGLSSEELEKMREAYARDVAVLPPADVHDIIKSGGFDLPVHFFQSGMIHGWFARRSPA
ncbi:MAG TPA: class I SAM-dependent methyltransferase [Chthoniobacteraceae bacterium]|nr:class I SAM-dependent methyltransferase [Chthoniobacteraceae bacterium]